LGLRTGQVMISDEVMEKIATFMARITIFLIIIKIASLWGGAG
jgi:hypothetical protein